MKKLFSDILVSNKKENNNFEVLIDNLEPTFGITLKNFIRRSLISFSSSYKVFALKIDNVNHELQNIDGVLENTLDIIENLQKINFSHKNKELHDDEVYTFSLNNTSETKILAKDFISQNKDITISNKKLNLFKKTNEKEINIEFFVRKDTGFVAKINNLKFINNNNSFIVMDTDFSFIENLKIENEEYFSSFDQKREKLIISFTSYNEDALVIFSQTMFEFGELLQKISTLDVKVEKKIEENKQINVIDINVSKRLKSCLDALEITDLNQLKKYTLEEISSIKSLGKVTLFELKSLMERYNISFKL